MTTYRKAVAAARKVLKAGGCITAADSAARKVWEVEYPANQDIVTRLAWECTKDAKFGS